MDVRAELLKKRIQAEVIETSVCTTIKTNPTQTDRAEALLQDLFPGETIIRAEDLLIVKK